jgi:hypothetical protein
MRPGSGARKRRLSPCNDPIAVRILAIDWSGRRTNAGAAIWLAEAVDGKLRRVEGGRDRREVIEHVQAEARRDPQLVVGLDFAFSVPEWFARREGAGEARTVWRLVARRGEDWLRDPQPPFWRTRRPELAEPVFRRTELAVAGPGIRPKSVFQLVGAGNVGTGSLRGMPFLLELSERFAVWPFDEPRLPLAVEVYPRLHLADGWARTLPPMPNEHARDAAATALAMSSWRGDWTGLPSGDELEGRIWCPEAPLHSNP